ncbi:MAG: hypothetical protein OXI25_08220 [Chloroflexota bacterium]|nr:hypothetical protein [Chloroflexota bacterium]
MGERIYTMTSDGGIEPLEEERFELEDHLQSLVATHPELLDGEQMRPGDPLRWLLVTREKGISATEDEGHRWAVDHLLIDQDALPTLVEVKRGDNTEIRRTVIGQMLEYATHAAQTWTADELRRSFEASANARGVDPADELRKFLELPLEPAEPGEEQEGGDFWERVATNLDARRMRLLFVADELPDELKRVVEFLNAQMPGIEVLAVEIKQFRGAATQTLVPRVYGRLAKEQPGGSSSGPRPLITRGDLLAAFPDDTTRNAAQKILDAAQGAGARIEWGSRGVSVRARCAAWYQPLTVAWLFPPGKPGWMGLRNASFGEAISDYERPAPAPVRDILDRYVNQFANDSFERGDPWGDKGWVSKAWSIDYTTAAANIDVLTERLVKVITELQALPSPEA